MLVVGPDRFSRFENWIQTDRRVKYIYIDYQKKKIFCTYKIWINSSKQFENI